MSICLCRSANGEQTAWELKAYFLLFRGHSLKKISLAHRISSYIVNNVFSSVKFHSELKENDGKNKELFIYLFWLYYTKFSVADYIASICRIQNVGVAHDSLEIDTEQYIIMGHDSLRIEHRICAFSTVDS